MPASPAMPAGTVQIRPMLEPLARNWWVWLVRGILAILFAVLTIVWPVLTLFTLVILYGVFALIDGLFALFAAFTKGPPAPRWWLGLVGIFGLLAGALTLAWPGITGVVLLYFIAGWAIASGIFQLIGAIQLRKEVEREFWLIANGIISIIFGALIIAYPAAGALSLAFVIALFAMVSGFLSIGFAFRLKKLNEPKI